MNDIITKNLFEFWGFIGQKNNIYIESSNYKAVSVVGSDWPKRVYCFSSLVKTMHFSARLSVSTNILF